MSIWFEGYGCTANQGETLEMRDHANELGHEIAKDSSSAKTVVLGTCTVIESTQNKMEKRISELMDQGKNVIVSGCMATADTKVLNSKFPNAPLVSPGDINGLGDLIGRGGSWLDTGNIKDFYDASNFISVIENRQGYKIACLEEISYNKKIMNQEIINLENSY